jgi:hypothetical protein
VPPLEVVIVEANPLAEPPAEQSEVTQATAVSGGVFQGTVATLHVEASEL